MRCINQEKNLNECSCSYETCNKKGVCCECVKYHRENGEIPGCFFTQDKEITYDRSIKNFLKSQI